MTWSECADAVKKVSESFVPGASDEALASFEKATGIELPISVREWLKHCNGAHLDKGMFLLGCDPSQEGLYIGAALPSVPSGWLPLGDDGCGNCFALPLAGAKQPVLYFEMEEGDEVGYVVASSLLVFVQTTARLKGAFERWPMSKARLKKTDPDIDKISGYRMSWEVDDDED